MSFCPQSKFNNCNNNFCLHYVLVNLDSTSFYKQKLDSEHWWNGMVIITWCAWTGSVLIATGILLLLCCEWLIACCCWPSSWAAGLGWWCWCCCEWCTWLLATDWVIFSSTPLNWDSTMHWRLMQAFLSLPGPPYLNWNVCVLYPDRGIYFDFLPI